MVYLRIRISGGRKVNGSGFGWKFWRRRVGKLRCEVWMLREGRVGV